MKTQKTKLIFNKKNITELNREELLDINGGSSNLCIGIGVGVVIAVVLAGAFTAGVVEGFANEINDDDPNEKP